MQIADPFEGAGESKMGPQNRKVRSEKRTRLLSHGVPGLFCCALFLLANAYP
jgi:hypothetical protein